MKQLSLITTIYFINYLLRCKNGVNIMVLEIIGNEGKYLVKDPSNIVQIKFDNSGKENGRSIIHIIADTINDKEDRIKVSAKILEYVAK